MKRTLLLALLALLLCVFCACDKNGGKPNEEATIGRTEELTPMVTEPERTRVPVIESTLPPIGELTEAPATEAPLDSSAFLPETFDRGEGDLDIVTDVPGYGNVN